MPGLGTPLPLVIGGTVVAAASIPAPEQARDVFVDPLTGQWALDGGDLALVADAEAVAQDVRFRVGLVLGEWFLDESDGTDWYGSILVKNPNLVLVREIIRERIADTVGVLSLDALDVTFDEVRRSLAVNFQATYNPNAFVEAL